MFRKIVIIAPLLLAACGGHHDKQAPKPEEPGKGIPLPDVSKLPADVRARMGGVMPNAEVMRMRQISGRWQSDIGTLGEKDRWLTVDIANNRKFSLEQRGSMGKMEAVYATAMGEMQWTPTGTVTARTDGVKGAIAPFATWTASFPSPGKMQIKDSAGKAYMMTYRGL